MKELCEAVLSNGDLADTRYNFAMVLVQTGKRAKAKSDFEQAIRKKPGYAAAHYNLGLALQKVGDGESAKNAVRDRAPARSEHRTVAWHKEKKAREI